ncbi:hypothetical protein G6O69_18585 [Pseudenhygromyxa sp. WMMC2535]|uniref:hypothetical protein n=1 Tax=Pseudenhygromyxa sp. WMMC2535 TaxID=2712867 RepID=UPI001557D969|nr:hypothetical protein [Pseudenhygromyxa sp. WMMC2535]NVB39857.1 hypothetical protein [Pseudenhygromyxa sp. WMMC2535]
MTTSERFIFTSDDGRLHYNGFRASAIVGDLMFQWGQDVSTADKAQSFFYHREFGSRCHAMLVCCSRSNARQAVPVQNRGASEFVLDRGKDIDGYYPFYWFAVGDAPDTAQDDPRSVSLGETTLMWGDATSTSDKLERFEMPAALGVGVDAALATVTKANVRAVLSISSFEGPAAKLTLNRHNDFSGAVDFNYVAVGASEGEQSRGVQDCGGFKLQWGQAVSDTDREQLFMMPEPFRDMDFAVFTSRSQSNTKAILPLARPINSNSFIVERNSAIDGAQSFYWLAIGF